VGEIRPLRADARRNRDRLLAVAVESFQGDADVPLDAIARRAEVGIGTLYRHFPTREALVEAAYRSELDKLCAAVPVLLSSTPPAAALRQWMGLFVEYMTTRRGMADALKAVIAVGVNPFTHSRDRLLAALNALLSAGVAAGDVRADVAVPDLLAALSGVSLAVGDQAQRDQADRILDLLMAGLRMPARVSGGSGRGVTSA
jgi:AcrR family transcriptional regulator